MPIYAYQCKECNSGFDHLAKSMADKDSRVSCPQCGSGKTTRQLSTFAVASGEKTASAAMSEGGMCGCGKVRGSCGRG